MKELICIVCPKGCHLQVDETNGFSVSGNSCPRGAEYGKNEISDPRRTITSTVVIKNAVYRRCPVRTDRAVPKAKMFDVINALRDISLTSPVHRGDIVLSDAAGTGANVIVTKDM